MMNSTSGNRLQKFFAVLFWLSLWQIAAIRMNQPIILEGPITVFLRTIELAGRSESWLLILVTLRRIVSGLLLAFAIGSALGIASYRWKTVSVMIAPLLSSIRAVPIASFIVLLLMSIGVARLSVWIAFLISVPVFYENLLSGLTLRDPNLLEMLQVYQVPFSKRIRYYDIPALRPHLQTAFKMATGMAWKAGVAAEVIAKAPLTMGNELNRAKILLETKDVLAWTVLIVLVSFVCEKGILALLMRITPEKKL